jgi:hypothetical protein
MENIIVSLICIALMVVGGMTMSQGFLSSVDSSMGGWQDMGVRNEEIMRTDLAALDTSLPASNILEVSLRNSGQTKLNDFADWDVIVQYYGTDSVYYVKWLPYTAGTPGDNQWTVKGIYTDAASETTEVFEPGILNPGEEIIIRAKLNPSVGRHTTNLVIVSTPNGVSASTAFYRG